MDKRELVRRYAFFMVSVFVNAFSIAVITKALLGTSPISSVPYVLSLSAPPTMGAFTIMMNFLFIILEVLLLGRKEALKRRYELLAQIPITLCFGLFIDLSMHGVLFWLEPRSYVAQLFSLLVGCAILGLGVSMEVKAGVAMVTGEYLVNIISKSLRREFGIVKVCFDVTLVVIACALSLVFLGHIEGVREGTVAAALLVGPISHFIYPYLQVFDGLLSPAAAVVEKHPQAEKRPVVITIAREYGSGGHLLGRMLADRLGIEYYDKALISLAAEEGKMTEKYISDNEQRMSSNTLLNIILRDYGAPITKSLSPSDAVFVAQSRVIRRIAGERSCVILGRLGDYILKDYPKSSIIRVFCHTSPEDACRRCVEEYGVNAQTVKSDIEQTNRARVSHYQYYTGRRWGDPHNYDITVNTGSMGMEVACDIIAALYEKKLNGEA